MNENQFSIKKRIRSFKYAFSGLKLLFKEEHNARIHLFVSIIVLATSFIVGLNNNEWIAVIFSIGMVITVEIINTAIEHVANFLTTEKDIRIKKIKDLGAAAVLVSSILAIAVGLIIFIPKMFE